jgi:hypothetical protein
MRSGRKIKAEARMSGDSLAVGAVAPDAQAVAGPDWRSFSALLLAAAAGLFVALVAALAVIDPYDTGRPGILRARGVHEQYPLTANASRARDPRFDAAVIGNSHVQMLRPDRLDALTGLRFVSLIMPATYPPEQLDVLRWFQMNRAHPARAVAIGMDRFWCLHETAPNARFPAWLYAEDFPSYLAGLVRYRSLEAAAARIRLLRTGKGGARPDGYWDYGPDYAQRGLAAEEPSRRKLATRPEDPFNPTGEFPPLDRLRVALSGLPPETAVLLVRPPVYRTALPEPGSVREQAARSCRAKMEEVAASRPRTALVDLVGRYADDPADYYDHAHYRESLARRVEQDVAAAFARLGAPNLAAP